MGRMQRIARGLLGFSVLLVVALAAVVALAPSASARAVSRAHPAAATTPKAKKHKPARCRPTRKHRCVRKPPAPIRPAVSTGQARAVSSGAATLTATLQIRSRTATYWFQYGPTSAYGSQTSAAAARTGKAVTVSTAVGGLAAGNTYHYRVVASSCDGCSSGTAYGTDVTFIAGGYTDPVFTGFGADPFVLDNGNTHADYWEFSTGTLFPALHSTDLVHWASAGAAMVQRPAWVIQTGDWHPWGPSVVEVAGPCPGTGSSTCYVMFYTGLSAYFHMNCIGIATATAPGGPYADQGILSDGVLDANGRPLGCGDNHGYGQIDPSPFTDASGRSYLYVSVFWTCAPWATSCNATDAHVAPTLSAIPLSSDHLSAAGPRVPVLTGDPGTWENVGTSLPNVEGPAMVLHNGTYYLFYSAGSYHDAYGMGYATAASPTGPFTKSPNNPILTQTTSIYSPGGGDVPVIGPHGGSWLVYHGREGSYAANRVLRIEPLSWRSQAYGPDAPVLGQPTDAPQAFAP